MPKSENKLVYLLCGIYGKYIWYVWEENKLVLLKAATSLFLIYEESASQLNQVFVNANIKIITKAKRESEAKKKISILKHLTDSQQLFKCILSPCWQSKIFSKIFPFWFPIIQFNVFDTSNRILKEFLDGIQDKYRRIEQIDQKCINSYWYWITLRSHFAQLLPSTPPHYQLIRIVLRRRMSSAIRQSLTSKWLFTPVHLRAILYSSPTGFKGKIEMQKIINLCFLYKREPPCHCCNAQSDLSLGIKKNKEMMEEQKDCSEQRDLGNYCEKNRLFCTRKKYFFRFL